MSEGIDKVAERIFEENIGDLTKYCISAKNINMSNEGIEGEDILSGLVFPNLQASDEHTRQYLLEKMKAFGLNEEIRIGGKREVKGIRHFLDRNNDGGEASGTLSFEIFGRWMDDRSKPYAGWTLALYNPDLLNEIKKAHNAITSAEKTDILAFILFDREDKPFACVAFEHINKLIEKLNECFPQEWDMKNFNLPPLDNAEFWRRYTNERGWYKYWETDRGGMILNNWHIPFRRLAGVTTVTMIGDNDPDISGASNGTSEALQRRRLEYLKAYARDKLQINDKWQCLKYKERRLSYAKMEENKRAKENGLTPVTYYIAKHIPDEEVTDETP